MMQSNEINRIYNYACTLFVTPYVHVVPRGYQNWQYYWKLGQTDLRNKQWLKPPKEFAISRDCICYDSCFLLKELLNNIGVENKIYYSCTQDVEKYQDGQYYYTTDAKRPTHAMIIYKEDGLWKWMQYSWKANIRNNWQTETIEELMQKYKTMAEISWHKPIYFTDITDFQVDCPRLDFFRKALKKIEVEQCLN